ncbi:MAG: protein-L-isoaspartate O-methyltransferase, partial [Acidimicrobiia bacterium]|nr:protein-L-isoaspartate O-methyltransferase [Acidimicrobiia bacterium]
MVHRDLAGRGVRDQRVLEAMGSVPREAFVPAGQRRSAYADRALPLRFGQTVSQPYVVAVTLEALRLAPGDRALEVGAGSGYAAAVAGRLVAEVFAVERIESLAADARQRLESLG